MLGAAGPATAPVTQPATTEPWRPSVGHPASIGILLSPGIAPCVVHVNAERFPLLHGTPLTARYSWNFGDPGGAYNALPGFNAAHFYEGPGQYQITLNVTDETGVVTTSRATIVISPDRRHVVFVSPEGSDMNAGTSAEAPLHSLGKALTLKNLPDNTAILLRRRNLFRRQHTENQPFEFCDRAVR